jgi:hypothetical protein
MGAVAGRQAKAEDLYRMNDRTAAERTTFENKPQ